MFAQGSDVSINSLKNKEGGEISVENNYEVSCSSTDGGGLTSYVTETPDKGYVPEGAGGSVYGTFWHHGGGLHTGCKRR